MTIQPQGADPIAEMVRAGKASYEPQQKASRAERLSAFLVLLKRARSLKATAAVVAAEMASLRADYAATTLPVVLHYYRRGIAEKIREGHPAIGMLLSEPAAAKAGVKKEHRLGPTRNEVTALRRRNRRRVAKYQHAQIPIRAPKKLISTAVELVEDPGEWPSDHPRLRAEQKGKPRWDHLIVGLVLLTGRRPYELAVTGSFKRSRKRGDWLVFAGQAKSRGAAVAPYDIPLLASPRIILGAWRTLRSVLPDFESMVDFNNRTASRCAKVVREIFPEFNFKLYDFRAIYARLTYHLFAPEEMTDLAWFSRVLGHTILVEENPGKDAQLADTLTAAFYQRFYLPRKHSKWR